MIDHNDVATATVIIFMFDLILGSMNKVKTGGLGGGSSLSCFWGLSVVFNLAARLSCYINSNIYLMDSSFRLKVIAED